MSGATDSRSCLTVDLGVSTGWAFGRVTDNKPLLGVWLLPEKAPIEERYVALDNELHDAFMVHQPSRFVVAARFFAKQTSAEFLMGLYAIAIAAACRAGVPSYKVAESTAREKVLGRGSFVTRDPITKKPIKGSGTEGAKAAALQFCQIMGWNAPSHDAADAAIVWEYDRLVYIGQRKAR